MQKKILTGTIIIVALMFITGLSLQIAINDMQERSRMLEQYIRFHSDIPLDSISANQRELYEYPVKQKFSLQRLFYSVETFFDRRRNSDTRSRRITTVDEGHPSKIIEFVPINSKSLSRQVSGSSRREYISSDALYSNFTWLQLNKEKNLGESSVRIDDGSSLFSSNRVLSDELGAMTYSGLSYRSFAPSGSTGGSPPPEEFVPFGTNPPPEEGSSSTDGNPPPEEAPVGGGLLLLLTAAVIYDIKKYIRAG